MRCALTKGKKTCYKNYKYSLYSFLSKVEVLGVYIEELEVSLRVFEDILPKLHDLSIPNPMAGWSTLREVECSQKVRVKTMTIDSFVEKERIERVDFIKIDTEGAEREIIKGARETIKRFKPKMAISAYHLPDDKKVIPELILSIRDDYKFKLVNKGEEDLFFY